MKRPTIGEVARFIGISIGRWVQFLGLLLWALLHPRER